MTLAFFDFGILEVLLIVLDIILIIWVARLGKDTALGYFGTLLIAIFGSPLLALIIILILKTRRRS
ncbi:hypothetical protein FO440_06255 [Mucilaginibacter corticis]|uniref:Uncharacterized protein n=1 Tax=Mucilaginibacter corticis TaxID=2597670 RepID=A0A556MV52_9SPHI|nr:hypothetical protein [Mucilaginibacter corticis]TSJ43787.1 hypothetical protein FO440_06255 [Mucilaginibacter corticis]